MMAFPWDRASRVSRMGVMLLGALALLVPLGMRLRAGEPAGDSSSQARGGFRLSEAPPSSRRAPPRSAQGKDGGAAPALGMDATALGPEETSRLLDDLPPLPARTAQPELPQLPSSPRPRTRKLVEDAFSPEQLAASDRPESPPGSELRVLRFSPEGEVPRADGLSVTFSEPMVPLAALDDVDHARVPARLTPDVPGRWQWLGTRTLVFEPEGRFPVATEFSVEIPAGTRSVTASSLAAPVTWRFATTPPEPEAAFPRSGKEQAPDTLVLLKFAGRVDPEAVLGTVRVTARGKDFRLRFASQEEVRGCARLMREVEHAEEGSWLAFRVAETLPPESEVTVAVGPGTPSREGPRRLETARLFSFATPGPLRVLKEESGPVVPGDPFFVQLTNDLEEGPVRPGQVRVEPEIPELSTHVHGPLVCVQGKTRARTTYRVILSASLRDAFGQELGQDTSVPFSVGPEPPLLWTPKRLEGRSEEKPFVLHPAEGGSFRVFSVNHASLCARVNVVKPEDWSRYLEYVADLKCYASLEPEIRKGEAPPDPPGSPAVSRHIVVSGAPDEMVETSLDLTPVLPGGTGQVIVVIEAGVDRRSAPEWELVPTWVQVTHMALDVFADDSEATAWVTSLERALPLERVEIGFVGGETALTGRDGIAVLALPEKSATRVLVARRGDDAAILPETSSGSSRRLGQAPSRGEVLVHVFDDRQLYRPGEEVHVKGWARVVGPGKRGDLELPGKRLQKLEYVVEDSRGQEACRGEAQVGALGGFDFHFRLPPGMPLDYAGIRLHESSAGGEGEDLSVDLAYHTIRVEEFRRPEFRVSLSLDRETCFAGCRGEVSLAAGYFSGGRLPGAPATWAVDSALRRFDPPGREDFTFGYTGYRDLVDDPGAVHAETLRGVTDDEGRHRLRIDFRAIDPPSPLEVSVQGSVQDKSLQSWGDAALLFVHPASLYVGLKGRGFYLEGEPLRVEAIVTDLEGRAASARKILLRDVRFRWKKVSEKWVAEELDCRAKEIVSAGEPAACDLGEALEGSHRIEAWIEDDEGRKNFTALEAFVAGKGRIAPRQGGGGTLALLPEREAHHPGETAEILGLAPFHPAVGLLTLRRSGLLEARRFEVSGSTFTLRIPMKETYIPNVSVRVDLIASGAEAGPENERRSSRGSASRELPATASADLTLEILPSTRRLSVEVLPRDAALDPGAETTVDVTVRDSSGSPVHGAEVALVVVDEAVLSLAGYAFRDPLSTFYGWREAGVEGRSLRSHVLRAPESPLDIREVEEDAPECITFYGQNAEMVQFAPADEGALSARGARAASRLRKDFNPLAAFFPALRTGADGRARATIKMPDSLTRYRVAAFAAGGPGSFGTAESSIAVRRALALRPSPPRFLRLGDKAEIPLLVQNLSQAPLEVDVALRASNLEILGPAGRRIVVAAGDRADLRFPAVPLCARAAVVQVALGSGSVRDSVECEIPILPPAVLETFATYGEIDDGSVELALGVPSGANQAYGGLDLTTSSTELQSLTDALLYLMAYPHECAEQVSSRLLAVAALRDVLSAFRASGLPPEGEILAAVERDVTKLRALQRPDGSFALWRVDEAQEGSSGAATEEPARDDGVEVETIADDGEDDDVDREETEDDDEGPNSPDPWPYVSIHVAHALARAKERGLLVPEEMLERSFEYLKRAHRSMAPSRYSDAERWTLEAYAVHVLEKLSIILGREWRAPAGRARKLAALAASGGLPLEAAGWILPFLSRRGDLRDEFSRVSRRIQNSLRETAGVAHFESDYPDGAPLLFYSEGRTEAVILDALLEVSPRSDLPPKLARGLLARRSKGRWLNTQENAFVLLALSGYFRRAEVKEPSFRARAWLDDVVLLDRRFEGRSADERQLHVPTTFLQPKDGDGSPRSLLLLKEGDGRLYYRVALEVAPAGPRVTARDRGFAVNRIYGPIDDPTDVRRDPDGAWRIRAGARVRVGLALFVPRERFHVALVDHLPAGLEIINPGLLMAAGPFESPDVESRWGAAWLEDGWQAHENLRDDRVEVFGYTLEPGTHAYSYRARATTPGTFMAPPATAEEMYQPESFGRSAGDMVIVELRPAG